MNFSHGTEEDFNFHCVFGVVVELSFAGGTIDDCS